MNAVANLWLWKWRGKKKKEKKLGTLLLACVVTQKHNPMHLCIITNISILFQWKYWLWHWLTLYVYVHHSLSSLCVQASCQLALGYNAENFISETRNVWQLILDILPSNALAHVEYSYQITSACLRFKKYFWWRKCPPYSNFIWQRNKQNYILEVGNLSMIYTFLVCF